MVDNLVTAQGKPDAEQAPQTDKSAPKKPVRSKRGKKRPRPPANEDFVKVVPLKIQDDPTLPLQISKARRGKHAKISADNMSFSSSEGLGVGTARQEIDAPCGYTESSFGYRDVDGSKVHKAWREPYAEPYKEGDTVGVYLHLPEGGKPHETKTEVVRWRGRLFQTDDGPSEVAKPLVGSILGFSINGKWQGAAFKDIPEGTYYAAASLFTAPKPEKMASLTFNFGPDFKFGPPKEPDLPLAKPFCDVQPPPAPVPDSNGCITVDKVVAAIVSEPAE